MLYRHLHLLIRGSYSYYSQVHCLTCILSPYTVSGIQCWQLISENLTQLQLFELCVYAPWIRHKISHWKVKLLQKWIFGLSDLLQQLEKIHIFQYIFLVRVLWTVRELEQAVEYDWWHQMGLIQRYLTGITNVIWVCVQPFPHPPKIQMQAQNPPISRFKLLHKCSNFQNHFLLALISLVVLTFAQMCQNACWKV